MKNQPDQSATEYPSWGQGPFVQAEESLEGDEAARGGQQPDGNAVGQGSCYECQAI